MRRSRRTAGRRRSAGRATRRPHHRLRRSPSPLNLACIRTHLTTDQAPTAPAAGQLGPSPEWRFDDVPAAENARETRSRCADAAAAVQLAAEPAHADGRRRPARLQQLVQSGSTAAAARPHGARPASHALERSGATSTTAALPRHAGPLGRHGAGMDRRRKLGSGPERLAAGATCSAARLARRGAATAHH